MAKKISPRRPTTGNQERAERTRAAVIDEAVRCILDEGFTAPSVRHIADRAGLTWGGVQYHFGDLTGLLTAVVDQGLGDLVASLDNLPPPAPDVRATQRTAEVIDAVWQTFSSPTSRAAMEILIATRSSRDATANAHLTELMKTLTALGERLGHGLAAPHAVEIGNLVWAALRGMVVTQMVSPVPVDTSRDRKTLTAVITAYVNAHALAAELPR